MGRSLDFDGLKGTNRREVSLTHNRVHEEKAWASQKKDIFGSLTSCEPPAFQVQVVGVVERATPRPLPSELAAWLGDHEKTVLYISSLRHHVGGFWDRFVGPLRKKTKVCAVLDAFGVVNEGGFWRLFGWSKRGPMFVEAQASGHEDHPILWWNRRAR